MAKTNGPPTENGLDPDLAQLLSIEEPKQQAEGSPEFGALFTDEKVDLKGGEQIDVSKKQFDPITKFQEDPKPIFKDKDYYKKVLSGERDHGQRVHELLGKFMKATDIEEKAKFRAQLITAYWELATSVAGKVGKDLPMPKRLLIRFGILSPSFLTNEHRDMVSRIIFENATGEPLWYVDEWLERIASGLIRPSSTDEVKKVQKDAGKKLVDEVERKRGQRETELTILRGKIGQLEEREALLREQVETLSRHEIRYEYGNLKACFNASQKAAFSQIQDTLRQLTSLDGQIASSYVILSNTDKELESLSRKSEGVSFDSVVDQKTVAGEFQSVRQMAKMTVGRKGNHFPIFLAQFVRPLIQEIGTRENVIKAMTQVEALDPGLFLRTHKQQTTRIVPNTLLLASYGDTGICWEAFEKYNRATSRGRIAIPIFAKNIQLAVLTALADLRWQVAKEKAAYYWMEEGLTGKYYQWFSERKLKGDVREYFIRDYLIWITKESQGNQKLDREVRGIFWRIMPFPQAVKDSLKNRGFVYNELYKKDQNIARSDGYC
jgi:hypothetical protein